MPLFPRRLALPLLLSAQIAAGAYLWAHGDAALRPEDPADLLWLRGNATSGPADPAAFLEPGLQATAAATGIVFAISIIAVEHAASNYSQSMLVRFRRDPGFLAALGYGVAATGLMAAAIALGLQIAVLCLQMFLANLAVLALYLRHVIRLIGPAGVIRGIEADALALMRKARGGPSRGRAAGGQPRRAAADLLVPRSVLAHETSLWQAVRACRARGDYESVGLGFDAYVRLVRRYLELNRGGIWPEDAFIGRMLDRAADYAALAAKGGDSAIFAQAVNLCDRMAQELGALEPPRPGGRVAPTLARDPAGPDGGDPGWAVHRALERLIGDLGQAARLLPRESLRGEAVRIAARALGHMGQLSVAGSAGRLVASDNGAVREILRLGEAELILGHGATGSCSRYAAKILRLRIALQGDAQFEDDIASYTKYLVDATKSDGKFGMRFFSIAEKHGDPLLAEALAADTSASGMPEHVARHIMLVFEAAASVGSARTGEWSDLLKMEAATCMARMVAKHLRDRPGDLRSHGREVDRALSWICSAYGGAGPAAQIVKISELAAACVDGGGSEHAERCANEAYELARKSIEGQGEARDPLRTLGSACIIGCRMQRLKGGAPDSVVNGLEYTERKFRHRFRGHPGGAPLVEDAMEDLDLSGIMIPHIHEIMGPENRRALAERVAARRALMDSRSLP